MIVIIITRYTRQTSYTKYMPRSCRGAQRARAARHIPHTTAHFYPTVSSWAPRLVHSRGAPGELCVLCRVCSPDPCLRDSVACACRPVLCRPWISFPRDTLRAVSVFRRVGRDPRPPRLVSVVASMCRVSALRGALPAEVVRRRPAREAAVSHRRASSQEGASSQVLVRTRH